MKTVRVYFCDFWGGFDNNNNFIINRLRRYYNVEFDSVSPDFLFYSCFGLSHINFTRCVKIFYGYEAILPNFNECDYAIGFSPISFDKRYFQYRPYVERSNYEGGLNMANRKFCNFIYSQDSSGEGALFRKNFCKKLMEYKQVDCPGKVLHNMDNAITPRNGDWEKGKLDFIKNYKFTIAIENSGMEGYVTEKLTQPLQQYSVPIYWGAPDIGDFLNTKSFINLRDFKSVDDAIDYIRYVDSNDDEYMKFINTNPNLPRDDGELSLEEFLCSIIENKNVPFSKNPRKMWEPKERLLFEHAAKLAVLHFDSGNIQNAKECAEICMCLNTYRRVNIYPILEDIYGDNKIELLELLNRQKERLINFAIPYPEHLRELCKIAVCYIHLGELSAAEKIREYILREDPENIEAKNIMSEKGRRGGRKNKPLDHDVVIKNWEKFGEKGSASSEQRAKVLSYCFKYPICFVYDYKSYYAYRNILRLLWPYNIDGFSLIRVGSKNYGGHFMIEPGSQGIALGLGDFYDEWNFQMAQRGFDTYQYCKNISKPYKEHSNLKLKQINFTKDTLDNILTEISPSIDNIVMQMDVAGQEWELLDAVSESQLMGVRQMAIDFHGLTNEAKHELYLRVFKKINNTHRVVHVHYNNNVKVLCFKDFLISDVIRITYVRRDVGIFSISEKSFPLSMDYPTVSAFPEVFIGRFSDIFVDDEEQDNINDEIDVHVKAAWTELCQLAMSDMEWLRKKNVHNVNSTVLAGDEYLYPLCRLLVEYSPRNILEFNFDQTTKLTTQYAASHESSLTILANNRERVEHFMGCWEIPWRNTVIQGSDLAEVKDGEKNGVVYQNFDLVTKGKKYNLILLKSPLKDDVSIHMDVWSVLPDLIEDDFAILMDHVEDECGQKVFQEMMDVLEKNGISFMRKDFSAKNRLASMLFSESWKYIEEF